MPSGSRVVAAGLAVLALVMVGVARLTGGGAGSQDHPLGTEVVVGHVDRSGGERDVRTRIGVNVLDVRTGTQQQLAANGLEIDPEDRSATPYYLDARFTNRGQNAVKRDLDIGLEDADGNSIPRTVILSVFGKRAFRPCVAVEEGELAPGESYESCTLVLVPHGVKVGRVYFVGYNVPGYPEIVYWATE